jgi:hypothetical protein
VGSRTAVRGDTTLAGKVEESVNKDLAKQIALGVNGCSLTLRAAPQRP